MKQAAAGVMSDATKWLGVGLPALAALVAAVLGVAETRATANANEERIQKAERTLA